jgi:polyferredoxin
MDMVLFFAAGNVAYYAVAIGMALVLKDNRAFCKYMCPVAVPLKVASQFSVVKVQTDADACNGCSACTRMCPMDIDILAYVEKDRRVMSSDCIMCATCVAICTKDALKLSVELDGNGENYLRLLPAEESD